MLNVLMTCFSFILRFNEPLHDDYDGMTKICSDLSLTEFMFHLTGADGFKTYIQRHDHIDYILCDDWVTEAALNGCYEDHPNKTVDFDVQQLFGNPTYCLATPS